MKVCMLVKNSFQYDARVSKEARSLVDAGHEVTVIALLAPGVTPETETTPYGARVVRVRRAEFGLGRLLRRASGAAERAIRRDADSRGVAPDEARLAEARSLVPSSTAVPAAGPGPSPSQPSGSAPGGRRSRLSSARARLAVALVSPGRVAVRLMRAALGRPLGALRTRVLDRRMTAAGLAEAAEVYHAHDVNTLAVGRRCARRMGARLVYDSHELATERSRMGSWARRRARRSERRGLRSVDALIVASPVWLSILEDEHGRLPPITADVINTPETTEVEPIDIRPEVGLPPGLPVVLYQGSIQEHRGIEAAIDAVAALDGVALVVVGYGHHRPPLEAMVRDRGLGDRVRFFGPVSHDVLLRYTASADVGLCTIVSSSLSYHTSLPNKLFEYLMAGVPVLGSEAQEIARVVTGTGAGVTVPATDSEAVAAGITTLLEDPEPYRRAARDAARRYHWGIEAEKLLDVYRRLEAM